MELVYDPAENESFWEAIRSLPGFPRDDRIPLRKMVFESGALFHLPEILVELGVHKEKPLLVVMDPTPIRRGSESLKPLLLMELEKSGWKVESLVLQPDASGQVHTDMDQIEFVRSRLRPEHAVLSVGSGVVTDVSKHACYLFAKDGGQQLPYVVYQTANSVSAYTSNMAPVFVQGVKRTLVSRYPDALVCDLETLVDAPREMTVAGVGDLLAIYVSLPDWYLAFQLGMDDSYSELAHDLMGPVDEIFLAYADEIRNPTNTGMAILAKLISLAGLSMSLSHATTPMSGYEHVISHVLDMIREHNELALAQHGSQVALAALQASYAYQSFIDQFDPGQLNIHSCFPEMEPMRRKILQTFLQIDPTGKAGEECWSDYAQKLSLWRTKMNELEEFCENWDAHKIRLEELFRPANRLREVLQKINAPLDFAELDPPVGESDARFAFFNAPLMRKRLTIGDLLIFFCWDRERLWEEIRNWD